MSTRNLGTILDTWLKFDLKSLQRDLDTKVIELAQQQEDGDKSKKYLIEQSREFKKKATDEVKQAIGPMIKLFQSEIDSLSSRNKSLETLYLTLYKQLIELPDPKNAFESLGQLQKRAEKIQDYEIENKQLRETLDEYNTEFAQVRNQEVTIKNLNSKIKELEEKSEQMLQVRLKEKEKDLQKLFIDKEEQAKEIQLELVKKLGEKEAQLSQVQTNFNKIQAELFELKSRQDNLLNAKSCEIELLTQDLDKANERAASAERLLEHVQKATQKQMQEANFEPSTSQSKIDQITRTNLEIELTSKEREISQLVEDIQKLQAKFNKIHENIDNERLLNDEKLAKYKELVDELKQEIKLKQDYEEIKRELNVLKSIEFSNLYSNDSQKALDVLLLEKNHQLQSENTQLKNAHNDYKSLFDEEKAKNINLLTTIGEQKQLISDLERDLLRLGKNGVSDSSPLKAISSPNVQMTQIDLVSDLATPTNESISLLDIVTSQRERFRLRIQELECETISYKQQINIVQGDIEKLRADNLKLYEKIKFLQSYESNRKNVRIDDESIYNRYNLEYEKNLDPFSKFTSKEKQRRYASLKFHDKFTLNLGQFILSSKKARLVFCAYIFIIHLLIFLLTYSSAYNERSDRDLSAACANMYQEHMKNVHGQNDFHMPH